MRCARCCWPRFCWSSRDLCRQQQEQGGENGRVSNHIVDQIQAYIAEHYAEKLTLTGIASQFYISPYYLSRLFKKSINLSLIEYINGVRIKAAQNLIEKSNESISDIAEKDRLYDDGAFPPRL